MWRRTRLCPGGVATVEHSPLNRRSAHWRTGIIRCSVRVSMATMARCARSGRSCSRLARRSCWSAHDHLYERFAPQNADGQSDPQGCGSSSSGTGGAQPYGSRASAPNSEIVGQDEGVLRLTLKSDSYAWQFVPIAGRKVFRRGISDLSLMPACGQSLKHERPTGARAMLDHLLDRGFELFDGEGHLCVLVRHATNLQVGGLDLSAPASPGVTTACSSVGRSRILFRTHRYLSASSQRSFVHGTHFRILDQPPHQHVVFDPAVDAEFEDRRRRLSRSHGSS